MKSTDSTLKIYITEEARAELFKTISEDETEIKYYLSAEYLERVCLGKTQLSDAAYSQIRRLLKQEYKEWRLSMTKKHRTKSPSCSDLCEHSIYIESGDFMCDITNEVTIVDWKPLPCACPKKRRLNK